MSDEPIYVSPSTVKSLWQEYRIYADRMEFDTIYGKMEVPFEEVERIELRQSDVAGLMHGDLQLRNFRPALKLDWANFLEHVLIDTAQGFFRRILITPDDPTAFKTSLDAALDRYRDVSE